MNLQISFKLIPFHLNMINFWMNSYLYDMVFFGSNKKPPANTGGFF